MGRTADAVPGAVAQAQPLVFFFGTVPPGAASALPPGSSAYTDSLEAEAALRAAGAQARYLYRDCEPAFDLAADLALEWAEGFERKLLAGPSEFKAVASDPQSPLWKLGHDALFEIKGGIFESIFHTVLMRDIVRAHPGRAILAHATAGHALAAALHEACGAAAEVHGHGGGADAGGQPAPVPQPSWLSARLASLWNAFDTLVCMPALVRLGRLFRRGKPSQGAALVNSLGDMGQVSRGADGGIDVSDKYLEGLVPALLDARPGALKVGVNPPKLHRKRWANQWRVWRLAWSGGYVPWYFYAGLRDFLRHKDDRAHFKALVARCDAQPGFRALFEAGGFSFYEGLRPQLLSLLPEVLASSRLHLAIARRLVRRERLRLVVSVEAFSNLGRCLALALQATGGRLFGVQGGIITPKRVTNLGFFAPLLGGRTDLMPGRFFVWGTAYRDLLRQRYAVPAERIELMGFNRAKRVAPVGRAASGQRKKLLYVTGANALVCPYIMTHEEEAFTLAALAGNLPESAELVVRAHPRHHLGDYQSLLAGRPHVRVVSGAEVPLASDLADAACVLGKASTVLLEAANAGVPVLLVNLAGTPDFTGFLEGAEPLPCIRDVETIQPVLQRLLDEDPQALAETARRFSQAWCQGSAEEAASRFRRALP